MKNFIEDLYTKMKKNPISSDQLFAFAIGLSNNFDAHSELFDEFLSALTLNDLEIEGLDNKIINSVYPVLQLFRMYAMNNSSVYPEPYNTVTNFVFKKMEKFDKQLGSELIDEARTTLWSDIQLPLVENFVEIAAKQINAFADNGFEIAPNLLDRTFLLLKFSINSTVEEHFRKHPYLNITLSKLSQDIERLSENLEGIKAEVEKRISQIKFEEQLEAQNKIIKCLNDIRNALEAGGDLENLISRVNQIRIENKTFEKLKNNLQEISEKNDVNALTRILDDLIEFFKSLVGKDRVSKTKEGLHNFKAQIKLERKLSNQQHSAAA